jgi:CRP/FNR family transcriptional regulator
VSRTAALVEQLSLFEVDQRLARLLLSEARSRGKRDGATVTVELILTNQQIAARIGSVREVVSRALNRLQQNGLIAVEGRRITIPDEAVLQSYAGD